MHAVSLTRQSTKVVRYQTYVYAYTLINMICMEPEIGVQVVNSLESKLIEYILQMKRLYIGLEAKTCI